MYRKTSMSWSKHADFIFFDLLCFQIAFIIAYFIRQDSFNVYQDSTYREMAVVVGLIHLCVAFCGKCYNDILKRGWMVEFFSTIQHVALVIAGEVFYLFFSKTSSDYSRLNMVYFGVSSVLLLYVWRNFWKRHLLKNSVKVQEKRILLIIGELDDIKKVIDNFYKQAIRGFIIKGIVLREDNESGKIESVHEVPVVADFEGVEHYLESHVVDEVLFTHSYGKKLPQELIQKCESMGLTVHIQIPETEMLPSEAIIDNLSGIAVFSSCVKFVTTEELMIKRLMDIVGSIIGLILTGVVSVFVVPAIFIADPGPILFSQTRIGKNGRLFRLYKFRSMYQDAEKRKKELEEQNQISGPMFKIDADPRIIGSGSDGTKKGLGWFLRNSSLDEFPQFWNVLKGEMSLVGTRPPTVEEWEKYELHHRMRMAIKPGITGMWQVSGRSDILDFEEVVRLDTEYIRNWSLMLDIKILVKTVLVVVLRKGSR